MIKNVISVIDGEAGSCGKAKVFGEIATDKGIRLGASITSCMPNAGHTFVDENGNPLVFRNIPVASVNPNTELFISPGSAIDMNVFMEEYKRVKLILNGRKIFVHEMVPVIEKRHIEIEKEHIKSGSTYKGCGAVSAEKVIRYPFLKFFEGFEDAIVCSNDEWMDRLYAHLDNPDEHILLEGSQGCDLCLNHSGNYPYVTSRNVSTAQLLADAGISAERLLGTLMVIRPFPIRISDITQDGKVVYSGDYGTGRSLTWSQINLSSMYGGYPFEGDIESYSSAVDKAYIKKLLSHSSAIFLKQLFGESYRSKNPDNITVLEALELERLYYKAKGIRNYSSKIVKLPDFASDVEPNYIIDQSEQTTVTKMERKVFDLDIRQLKNNCRINTPYGLYLNFFQHLMYEYLKDKGNFEDYYFDHYIRRYLEWLESETKTEIYALGTGPCNGERILKRDLIRR